MTAPRISVVIPTYNRASLLREAIASVLAQTRPPDELIVVDDGSTDETAGTIPALDGRIRLIRQANAGPAAARNAALRAATGELIAFQDSDDLWMPEKLALQDAFLERHPRVDLVFTDMQVERRDRTVCRSFIGTMRCRRYLRASAEALDELFARLLFENCIGTPTVVLRRRGLERAGFFDESLRRVEDRDYWLRWAALGRCGYIDRPLVRRRLHGQNLVADEELRLLSLLRVLSRWTGDPAWRRRRAAALALRKAHYMLGAHYLKRGVPVAARAHLRRGLWLSGWGAKAAARLLQALLAPPGAAPQPPADE